MVIVTIIHNPIYIKLLWCEEFIETAEWSLIIKFLIERNAENHLIDSRSTRIEIKINYNLILFLHKKYKEAI